MFPAAGFVPIPALTNDSERRSSFRLDAHSRCFEGHFEGGPILPAVAHLALALVACRAADRRVLTGLRDFRLSRPLAPGDEVEVVWSEGPVPTSLRFEIVRDQQTASSGTLLFASGGAARG